MKKILIASGVAVLAVALIASAQGYTFNTNLTVGSTGQDVVALQTWLITSGFSIPSIASGAAQKGYFGSQTKAAVVKYQASKGLPSTGFVGPMTRGVLNGSAAMAPAAGSVCPTGMICTPIGAGNNLPANGVPAGPVGISTPGIAGTLSVSNSSSVANGATVNDGQSVDIAGFKLQAGPSDQLVTSGTVDFNVRPWLYFSTLSVVNQTTGQVVVAPMAISQSSFTEITAGSDYRITFSGINAVVPAGKQMNIVLHGQLLPSVGGTSRQGNVNLTYADIRSVDGTGVTSDSLYTGSTQGIYYQGVLLGNLVVAIDSSSPLNQIIQTQTGASTLGVPLAVFNVQSQNSASVLQGLNVDVTTTGSVPTTVFSSIQLTAGGMTYYGQATASTTNANVYTYAFSNMNVPLAINTGVQFKVIGNVAPGINGATAKVTVNTPTSCAAAATACVSTNFNGSDSSFNTPTVQAAGPVLSNITTFSTTGAISVTPGTVTVGPVTPTTVANVTGNTAASFNYTFTVTAGNSQLYVSAVPQFAVNFLTSLGAIGSAAATTSVPTSISGGTQVAGDTNSGLGSSATGAFVVPANGSRTFTVTAAINNAGNASTASNAIGQIAGVWYATTAANTSATSTESLFSSGLTSLQSPGVNLLTK